MRRMLTIGALLLLSAPPATAELLTRETRLSDTDMRPGGHFGFTISMDEGTVAVAPGRGRLFLYERHEQRCESPREFRRV